MLPQSRRSSPGAVAGGARATEAAHKERSHPFYVIPILWYCRRRSEKGNLSHRDHHGMKKVSFIAPATAISSRLKEWLQRRRLLSASLGYPQCLPTSPYDGGCPNIWFKITYIPAQHVIILCVDLQCRRDVRHNSMRRLTMPLRIGDNMCNQLLGGCKSYQINIHLIYCCLKHSFKCNYTHSVLESTEDQAICSFWLQRRTLRNI